jgi:CarD family transcriptional regulator
LLFRWALNPVLKGFLGSVTPCSGHRSAGYWPIMLFWRTQRAACLLMRGAYSAREPGDASVNGGGHRQERQDEMAQLKIGDTVLHPIYGAGILVSMEKRGTDGTVADYYVIELSEGKGRLLTPVDKLDELGIRKPVARRDRRELAKVFSGRPRRLSEDYRKRRTVIDERLRDGSFVEVGRVVRDLSWVESQGRATTGDRRMLQRAKDLLAKELAASDGISEEEALERIDVALERRLSASTAKST